MSTATIEGKSRIKIKIPASIKQVSVQLLAIIMVFALIARLLDVFELVEDISLALMAAMLILGYIHLRCMLRFQGWVNTYGLWVQLLFTFAANLVGSMALLFSMLNIGPISPYATLLFCMTWMFSLPFYAWVAIQCHVQVPARVFPPFIIADAWAAKASLSFEESGFGIVWRFEDDGNGDLPRTDERVFAPANMGVINFGSLFAAYVLWHNTRLRPEAPIQVSSTAINDKHGIYHWEFYHRHHWYSLTRKRVDPALSIAENRLRFKEWRSKMDPTRLVKAPLIVVRRVAPNLKIIDNQQVARQNLNF